QAYRLLVESMQNEFEVCYPLHLGVTEAGDGEDGRIKSAIGIGTLLEDGIGDTIRVSLTEDPEFEIPVCKDIVKRYSIAKQRADVPFMDKIPYDPYNYRRRTSTQVSTIGGKQVPVVVANFLDKNDISTLDLEAIGYRYDADLDKWNISDGAADYIYTGIQLVNFALPGTLKVLVDHSTWLKAADNEKYFPLFSLEELTTEPIKSPTLNFLSVDVSEVSEWGTMFKVIIADPTIVVCLESTGDSSLLMIRRFICEMMNRGINNPVVLKVKSIQEMVDEQLIHFSTESGALLLDGMGDGIWLLNNTKEEPKTLKMSGRTYLEVKNNDQFLNNTAFSILQAT
ncbi:MAG: flavodoxin-dependent (E)-4-hydroxy-3-methylbut-2-enyl-diphosphate synthase, partial [Bacteroidota bacterium]